MSQLSYAIMGHKPTRFKFKYKEEYTLCKKLKKKMQEQFRSLYETGIRNFYVGSTLGVDLWAAEIILRLKADPYYQDIQLFIILPFDKHHHKWDDKSRERLRFIKDNCSGQYLIDEKLTPDSYKKCDYFLIEHADIVFVVYDNDITSRTTVGQAVNYAKSKCLPIILLHPDTAQISDMQP